MKKSLIILIAALFSLTTSAQTNTHAQAKAALDKIAAALNVKAGAQANFILTPSKGSATQGTISLKGNKFYAKTPQATMWYNGKTQWSYMASTNEVSITTPNAKQQAQMNPYTFINLYNTGQYTLSVKTEGNNQVITMKAKSGSKQNITQAIITASKASNIPSKIVMTTPQGTVTITISNFKNVRLSDSLFTFKEKDYPSAEIVDLR